MLLSSLCKLRKAEYLGGGIIEEMTIKPLVEAGFLLSALTNLTQTIYYRIAIQAVTAYKGELTYKFYNKHIAPLKNKAANTELVFFASLVAVKRNLAPTFRVKGLVNQARNWQKTTYRLCSKDSTQ